MRACGVSMRAVYTEGDPARTPSVDGLGRNGVTAVGFLPIG